MAGMSAAESSRMVDLLRRLRRDHTLVLIEHDMDAVFAVADVITVMVNGAVLASGPPEKIRESRAVQDAYLAGTEAAGAPRLASNPPSWTQRAPTRIPAT